MHQPYQKTDFITLYVRHQTKLAAYIHSQIFNRADAEDVMQEVASVLWEKFDQYDPGRPFDSWAFQISKYHVLKYFEKRRRDAGVFSEELAALLADETRHAMADIEQTQDSLRFCLGKLAHPDRDLIRMKYEQELSNVDIAQRIKRSEGSVSRRLKRIYSLLHDCIESRSGLPE